MTLTKRQLDTKRRVLPRKEKVIAIPQLPDDVLQMIAMWYMQLRWDGERTKPLAPRLSIVSLLCTAKVFYSTIISTLYSAITLRSYNETTALLGYCKSSSLGHLRFLKGTRSNGEGLSSEIHIQDTACVLRRLTADPDIVYPMSMTLEGVTWMSTLSMEFGVAVRCAAIRMDQIYLPIDRLVTQEAILTANEARAVAGRPPMDIRGICLSGSADWVAETFHLVRQLERKEAPLTIDIHVEYVFDTSAKDSTGGYTDFGLWTRETCDLDTLGPMAIGSPLLNIFRCLKLDPRLYIDFTAGIVVIGGGHLSKWQKHQTCHPRLSVRSLGNDQCSNFKSPTDKAFLECISYTEETTERELLEKIIKWRHELCRRWC